MNARTPNLQDATSTNGVRTLVVDDSPLMLRILSQILQQAGGFDLVGTAEDGLQAVLAAASLSPQLVLMDLHMRQLDGAEATRRLKQLHNPPVVIIITSDDSPFAESMAAMAGADGFIVKAGDLSSRLTRKLQGLFPPGRPKGAVSRGTPCQTPPTDRSSPGCPA